MNPNQKTNPNDYKVVSFHNSTDFGFTPDMGCMYNGVPVNGKSGVGVEAGESLIVPYHIGQQIALNLAKASLNRKAPTTDQAGIPTGVPLWDDAGLMALKNSFITDLYSEEKPASMSQTDILLAKLEEYKKLTDDKLAELAGKPVQVAPTPEAKAATAVSYKDKAEVLAELEKRGIKHSKRDSKDTLEKLLA